MRVNILHGHVNSNNLIEYNYKEKWSNETGGQGDIFYGTWQGGLP